jgi:hypothetical protein
LKNAMVKKKRAEDENDEDCLPGAADIVRASATLKESKCCRRRAEIDFFAV